jgi:Domain of unknown function (DUF3536)/Glycosyl hydrolase family 57
MSESALVIHAHFYQPPRENPWTDRVPREPSAHPFHDWNERIQRECYRPNALSRILDGFGRVERIVNNYELLSFNIGPTLLSWMQREDPDTYACILAADRASRAARNGHGNAIAQGYNHAILPLCNERDRRTQVRWGISDFEHRFGRRPESLWLPETACNDETLGVLIDEGLDYVILSPDQAQRVRPLRKTEAPVEDQKGGDSEEDGGETDGDAAEPANEVPGEQPELTWRDVSNNTIDPGVAYRYFHRDGSGRSIAVFFYDGPVARSIAFEGALASSDGLLERLGRAEGGAGRIVHVATDGESYGHHFPYGERCLSYALDTLAEQRGFRVTNYGEYLEQHPPRLEVEIKPGPNGEGTAWSCSHGVGRWLRDCGCQDGARDGWNQAWRGPLRQALDFLRERAIEAFEDASGRLFEDAWRARDAYVHVLVGAVPREEFLHEQAGRHLRESEQIEALTLLEMQLHAMLMYTSCAWFFADISGIEAVQNLRYAARVLDLMEELELPSPRVKFLELLSGAVSNLPEMGNGADVFKRFVEPTRISTYGVGAHLAISGLVDDEPELAGELCGQVFDRRDVHTQRHGRLVVSTSRLLLESTSVRKQAEFATVAMHLGGIDFYCALKPFPGVQRYKRSSDRLWQAFHTESLATLLRVAHEEFGPEEYDLSHVLPEGRERVARLVFGDLLDRFSEQYAHLYDDNARIIEKVQEFGFVLPVELRAAAEFTLGRRFSREIQSNRGSDEPQDFRLAVELAERASQRGYQIDRGEASQAFGERIVEAVSEAIEEPTPMRVSTAKALLDLTKKLGLSPSLDRAQEAMMAARMKEGVVEELEQLAKPLGLAPAQPKG